MREFVKSLLSLSWATSLFGVRQMAPDAAAFQQVAAGAASGLSGAMKNLYDAGARMQSGLVDALFPQAAGDGAKPDSNATPLRVDSGRLNVTRFVVLGEGLAAGMGNFTLTEETQTGSFPAQMARQMGAALAQPLFQAPGIGDAPGFRKLPVVIPGPLQSTVLKQIPPVPAANLSAPGFTVADALHLRPRQPLVDRQDSKQTAANLILGIHGIAYGSKGPLPTQLECAIERKPTFAVVALGFAEALDAAIEGDPARLPAREAFRADYARIVHGLRASGAEVLVLTIPDPAVTAHFRRIESAARTLKLDPQTLTDVWGLRPDDRIGANELNEIAFQILGKAIQPLPKGLVLPSGKAEDLRTRIEALNQEIVSIAQAEGAHVFNVACFLKRLNDNGIRVGGRMLTADYLGGFYCLNGYYPGATGHALIANEILAILNREYGASFPPIDVASVMATDPVAAYRPAEGPNWSRRDLVQAPAPVRSAAAPSLNAAGPAPSAGKRAPLRLPPNLEQVLPLNPALSYFGDGIEALHCVAPETIPFGSGGNLLFGGLAMVDSHVTGNVRIRFSRPVNGCTRFQISFEGGLQGDDQVLAAPRFFKMPFRNNRVDDVPGFVSSGTLNLETGDVDTSRGALNVFAQYSSSALNALVRLNPTFPVPPAAPLSFPGQYGSACMTFEQRPDGLLDFSFVGATFVPLGPNIVWPLNFVGPSGQFATIPANGTVLHPHLALTTRPSAPVSVSTESPEVPCNTIEEYTLFAPVSSFGDVFSLEAPQLGGPATGRSRLLGRLQVQFGPRCGNMVPVAVSTTLAGGLLAPLDPTPLSQLFPGRLTPGPEGFYENLMFPFRTYSLNDLAIIDDPFDISVGALDLSSGRMLHPLLHRGFINQDLIFALIRVEPCTPQNSFMFRGPAEFRKGKRGARVFQFYGQHHIPYPPGFLFPDPNLATGFPIGPGSALDPYLWFWAVQDGESKDGVKHGGDELLSTRGERFSYRYEIPTGRDGLGATFEYVNHTQKGAFRMHSLSWVGAGNSGDGNFDILTFSGFGVWSKNGVERVEQAAVQICASESARYVGIQIGQADISNVNTPMPPDAFPVRPPEPGGYVCCIGLPQQPPPQPPPPRPCPAPPPCGATM